MLVELPGSDIDFAVNKQSGVSRQKQQPRLKIRILIDLMSKLAIPRNVTVVFRSSIYF